MANSACDGTDWRNGWLIQFVVFGEGVDVASAFNGLRRIIWRIHQASDDTDGEFGFGTIIG